MTTRIYVNRRAIAENAHTGQLAPCVRVDQDGERVDCHAVEICGPSRVVYSPRVTHDGAHVWIETESEVQPLNLETPDEV